MATTSTPTPASGIAANQLGDTPHSSDPPPSEPQSQEQQRQPARPISAAPYRRVSTPPSSSSLLSSSLFTPQRNHGPSLIEDILKEDILLEERRLSRSPPSPLSSVPAFLTSTPGHDASPMFDSPLAAAAPYSADVGRKSRSITPNSAAKKTRGSSTGRPQSANPLGYAYGMMLCVYILDVVTCTIVVFLCHQRSVLVFFYSRVELEGQPDVQFAACLIFSHYIHTRNITYMQENHPKRILCW